MRIEYYLNNILSRKDFDNFTVTELRDAYMSENSSYTDIVQTRHFIYRQILRFLKLGLLRKELALNSRESRYIKTTKFLNTEFDVRRKKPGRKKTIKNAFQHKNSLQDIKDKLKQYHVDLLASVGESEEYIRLYETTPELKVLLEEKYHSARNKSSKLLGQIKALNAVLSYYSDTTCN